MARATIDAMRLKPCSSCGRLLRAGDACPFCGATGVPATFAPTVAAVFLSVPLLAVSACTRPAESIYGGPEMLDPAPAESESTTPVPEKPAEADPAAPSEPQGEIYGSPETMDSSADDPRRRLEPAPGPESAGNQPDPGDSQEADPSLPEPEGVIYGTPEMIDPEPPDPSSEPEPTLDP